MPNAKKINTQAEDISIHTKQKCDVHDVPFSAIIRPMQSEVDEEKVLSLMETISDSKRRHRVPPLDLMWITGSEGGDYFFSFGGCHRYEAYKRLQAATVPCKIIKSTARDLHVYLGSSTPDLK